MAEHGKLTGRTRYRKGWFGKLVLQVEVWSWRLGSTDFDGDELVSVWRDARVEDLQFVVKGENNE